MFDNGKEGNYWNDYSGADSNGDGIGDTPYLIDADRQDTYPLTALVDIDSVTAPQESDPQVTEPFPIALVAAASATSVTIIGIGMFVYFKKRRRLRNA